MKAMLLAAGRGERMGPLTAAQPKPLLSLGPETLIERHLRRLADAGIGEIVINLSWLGGQIRAAVGDVTPWGQAVAYSEEGEPPLETAGGIVHALPLLGDEPFMVVSTDVVTDFDFTVLTGPGPGLGPGAEPAAGCLVLVPNPPHHPEGDFGMTAEGVLHREPPRYTYSGIGVLRPSLFRGLDPGITPLRSVLRPAARRGALRGIRFGGLWRDVGTPERLAEVTALLRARRAGARDGSTG